jgi:signal transduction histidine kinase
VVLTPIRDASSRLVGFVKVTRDLTERRNAEEERLRLAQAGEAVRLRDEFLSIASHELKTPLTALQLQLLNVQNQPPADEERRARNIDRARRLADRLGQLVETLLDVSRIATGKFKLTLESFDMGEAALEIVERLRDSASAAGCDLSVEVAAPIQGRWDRLRIEEVLTNLISNAIKYAAGQPIRVSVARGPDMAIIEVLDRGPGIFEAELTRIFERFERAASARHYGGMGLGLYVARQIAEAHGGTVVASNRPGGGASFVVRLPLHPPSSES